MKFCAKCIMPDTRPHITFNEKGVCIACQNNEKKIPESAEELNDYIHITTPSVWLILLAVGTFVAGLVIWSLTANLVTAVPAAAI